MSNTKAEADYNTNVAATNDQQAIEHHGKGAPAPAEAATVRPWTSDFLLPSIRFREPSAPKIGKRTD